MSVETRPAIEPVAAPQPKTVADVLRHAALLIEERGWCQVDFERGDGAHCMVGALIAVGGGRWSAAGHMAHVLLMERGTSMMWNDAKGRTAAEVIAALRAAADEADR